MCYKIASNFTPNKEGLFSIFHLFATCSIQVPNGFPSVTPFFNERITQEGEWKRFQLPLGGGSEEGKTNGGMGGGERHCGDWKVFSHHMGMVIGWRLKGFWSPHAGNNQKSFSCHRSMVIEVFLVTTRVWWLKFFTSPWGHGDKMFLVTTYMWQLRNFGCHSYLAIEFGHDQTTIMYFGHHKWICWQIQLP